MLELAIVNSNRDSEMVVLQLQMEYGRIDVATISGGFGNLRGFGCVGCWGCFLEGYRSKYKDSRNDSRNMDGSTASCD